MPIRFYTNEDEQPPQEKLAEEDRRLRIALDPTSTESLAAAAERLRKSYENQIKDGAHQRESVLGLREDEARLRALVLAVDGESTLAAVGRWIDQVYDVRRVLQPDDNETVTEAAQRVVSELQDLREVAGLAGVRQPSRRTRLLQAAWAAYHAGRAKLRGEP